MKIILSTEAAYVRGGAYADTPQKLAEGMYADIKYTPDVDTYREGLLKFDISAFSHGSVKFTIFNGDYVNMDADRTFDIYQVAPDWSMETVTFNNCPKGTLIAKDVSFNGKNPLIELSSPIEESLAKGDKVFSIRIVPKFQSGAGQTRIQFLGEDRPFIIVLDERPAKNYFEKLVDDKAQNDEVWAWAKKMFDEWHARYLSLPAVNENAKMIACDESQYTKSNYASQQSTTYETGKTLYKTRTLSAITDLDKYVSEEFKNAKLDKFGGIMIESLKSDATGFF